MCLKHSLQSTLAWANFNWHFNQHFAYLDKSYYPQGQKNVKISTHKNKPCVICSSTHYPISTDDKIELIAKHCHQISLQKKKPDVHIQWVNTSTCLYSHGIYEHTHSAKSRAFFKAKVKPEPPPDNHLLSLFGSAETLTAHAYLPFSLPGSGMAYTVLWYCTLTFTEEISPMLSEVLFFNQGSKTPPPFLKKRALLLSSKQEDFPRTKRSSFWEDWLRDVPFKTREGKPWVPSASTTIGGSTIHLHPV